MARRCLKAGTDGAAGVGVLLGCAVGAGASVGTSVSAGDALAWMLPLVGDGAAVKGRYTAWRLAAPIARRPGTVGMMSSTATMISTSAANVDTRMSNLPGSGSCKIMP
jgi:hypothetical protein